MPNNFNSNLKKSHYFNTQNEPKLNYSYCAFLDVLGFSAMVNQDPQGIILKDFYKIFNKCTEELKDEEKYATSYFKQFTDNILLAQPHFELEDDAYFGFTLMNIRKYQFYMAINGYFIRGGFTCDNLFIDDNLIYGPALLEAYHLESQKAEMPIVILSDTVKNHVNQYTKYFSESICPTRKSILILDNETYFVNYLSEITELFSFDVAFEFIYRCLNDHKIQIENNLQKFHQTSLLANDKIYEKYYFIAQYHNYYLTHFLPHYDIQSLFIQNIEPTSRISHLYK
ncbi:hypothetical protein J7624_00085 [Wohlfahrtiimonas chitiniclastica]|uniref:hypothetical protein n=1 Tax=Wohlfahrtiimonas chitiniclastica TaxID=400946 RepID=UPI001BD03A4C|nr:hypothetical protein [Wohlfahrtiimonas chitiniclastica]MBS7825548.1 hypothetical protein [Wohlfahrtiimonas chitiniclastica]